MEQVIRKYLDNEKVISTTQSFLRPERYGDPTARDMINACIENKDLRIFTVVCIANRLFEGLREMMALGHKLSVVETSSKWAGYLEEIYCGDSCFPSIFSLKETNTEDGVTMARASLDDIYFLCQVYNTSRYDILEKCASLKIYTDEQVCHLINDVINYSEGDVQLLKNIMEMGFKPSPENLSQAINRYCFAEAALIIDGGVNHTKDGKLWYEGLHEEDREIIDSELKALMPVRGKRAKAFR